MNIAENGASLEWPVIFLYPEFGQTDFIEAFHEDSTFVFFVDKGSFFYFINFVNFLSFDDHLDLMFSESPTWDTEKKYTKKSLTVTFLY